MRSAVALLALAAWALVAASGSAAAQEGVDAPVADEEPFDYDEDLPFEADEEDVEPPEEEALGPAGHSETWGVILALLGAAIVGLVLMHVFPGRRSK